MTYINFLILIYQFFKLDFLPLTDSNNLYTVIASANVPPQGDSSCFSNMIKYKWVKSLDSKKTVIGPLVFDVQMVRAINPNDTLSIHLHEKPIG